ncbi:TatD family hydrolase [Pseudomonadota bacterium]
MSNPSFFDSHCHLDFPHFEDDRDEVLSRMQEEGIDRCVSVAVDFEHLARLQKLAESRDGIWFSVGVHPNHEVAEEPTVEQLCRLSDHPKCVAIGETGMDFFRHHVDPAVQESRFRTHIRAAQQLSKPVIVHNRDADSESIRILTEEEIGKCGGIMHCFSADWETARAALDLDMYISFSGNVTFKRNDELREVARQVPMDRLLIETDSPYLAPMPHRGKRNEPTYVKHVARCIADVKGLSIQDVAETSTNNALKVFSI